MKYEIELRVTEAGNVKMMKMEKKELMAYVSGLISSFSLLSEDDEKEMLEMMKSLKVEEGMIDTKI